MAQSPPDGLRKDPATFRSTTFKDGIVILDPVTGHLITLAPFAQEILELLRDRIEAGIAARLPLLDALQAEMEMADYGPNLEDAASDRATQNLLNWVDLARHLYA